MESVLKKILIRVPLCMMGQSIKFYFLLLRLAGILLFTVELLEIRAHSYVLTDGLQFSKELTGKPFRVFLEISHKDCRLECLSRKACRSYNYCRHLLLCELKQHDIESGSSELIDSIGVIYSQKSDWQMQILHPSCNTCPNHTVCDATNTSDIQCHVRECHGSPYEIPNSRRLWDLQHVGAKAYYLCDDGYIMSGDSAVSVCELNGQWSKPQDACVHPDCLQMTPPPDANITSINVIFEEEKLYAYLQCPEFKIARSSPMACDISNGKYNNHITCCDIPDTDQWIKVFRLVGDGHVGSYGFWYYNSFTDNAVELAECQFRENSILDNWDNLPINQVKLEIFENNTSSEWVIFNGTGTTILSWFEQRRILNSSWTDITTTEIRYFNILGIHFNEKRLGRFLIANEFSNDCSFDMGWLFILSKKNCKEYAGIYPLILYASNHRLAEQKADLHIADKMEISVKLSE